MRRTITGNLQLGVLRAEGAPLAHEGLSTGQVEIVVDGLSDDVSLGSVLIHLGLRGNPPTEVEPPSKDAVHAAFLALADLVSRGLGHVGRLEYLDGGPPGRVAPVRHVAEPIGVVQERVLDACRAGEEWEWFAWYVNTPEGDAVARHALEGKETADYYLRRAVE